MKKNYVRPVSRTIGFIESVMVCVSVGGEDGPGGGSRKGNAMRDFWDEEEDDY